MKKILMLLVFLIAGVTYAQKELSKDYSYTVSSPYKVFDAYAKIYFSKNNQILTVKTEEDDILLQKFDSKGEKAVFKSEKKYEVKKLFPKNFQVEQILKIDNRFYFFYSTWDGDNDKEQLYVREIDFEKGEFTAESKLLFKVDGKVTANTYGGTHFDGVQPGVWTPNKFGFLTSLDEKRVLIQYRKKPETKRDTKSWDIIGLCSLDGNLNVLSTDEVKMPYTERRMDLLDYAIDGEGNSYALVKVFHDDSNEDKKKKKDKVANYHIELFRIKPGSKDIDITKIEVKDKFINGLWVYEGLDNTMICAGYYNNGKDYNATDGMMLFKVKKDGGLFDMSTHQIPLDIINAYEKEKDVKKNNKKEEDGEAEFKDLVLQELHINKKDGSIVLIGEQQYVVENTPNAMSNRSYSTFTYYYNDVLITKIDASGNLAWMKKLPKAQVGKKGQGGMSFKHIYANNNHYVLFLDNVKNFDLPKDKAPAGHLDGYGGYFTSYKISDTDGTAVNSSVFNVRDIEEMTIYQFATSRIVKTGEDEFALEVYKKKKEDVMIKVHIN